MAAWTAGCFTRKQVTWVGLAVATLFRDETKENLGNRIADAESRREDPLLNHSMDRKDFFFGDAVAEGELQRFCGDDGPAHGVLVSLLSKTCGGLTLGDQNEIVDCHNGDETKLEKAH